MGLGGWTQPAAAPHLRAADLDQYDGALVHWACDEAAAATNMSTTISAGFYNRDLVVSNVGIRESLFQTSRLIAAPTVLGGRSFNGTTSYARQNANAGLDAPLFTSIADGAGVTATGWFQSNNAAATQTIVCYAGDSATGVAADVMLFWVGLRNGVLTFNGQIIDSGIAIDKFVSTGIALDTGIHFFGVVFEVDPDQPGGYQRRARMYLDGRCVLIAAVNGSNTVYSGGTQGRWWVGARPTSATTRTDYFNGGIDDVVVTGVPLTTEYIRRQYARGMQDYTLNFEGDAGTYNVTTNVMNTAEQLCEVHTRVLVEDRFYAMIENRTLGGVKQYYSGSLTPGANPYVGNQCDPEGFVDITEMYGFNWLFSATISEDSDNQSNSATVKMRTRIGEMSVAPYSVGDVNSVNRYDKLLSENNRVKIEVACVPLGTGRGGAFPFWQLRFDGFIAKVESAEDETTISLVDRMAPLQDTWIEPNPRTGLDWEYGSTPSLTYVETILQQIVDDNDPAKYEILLIDDTGPAGTGFASPKAQVTILQPTTSPAPGKPGLFLAGDTCFIKGTGQTWADNPFPASPGFGFTVDSQTPPTSSVVTLNYKPLQYFASAPSAAQGRLYGAPSVLGYIGGKPSVYAPLTPGWAVNPYRVPASGPVSTALETLATAIGYSIRYAWDDEQQQWRLTFSRFRTVDTFKLALLRILKVGAQVLDKENARTVLTTEYNDASDPDVTGNNRRHTVNTVNTATRQRFGRRAARIGLASYDLVNTAAEAQTFTDQIADDLASPESETEITMFYNPLCVLGGAINLVQETDYASVIARSFGQAALNAAVGITGIETKLTRDGALQTVKTRRSSNGAQRTRKNGDLFQQVGFIGAQGLTPPSTAGITGALRVTTIQPTGSTNKGCYVTWTFPNKQNAAQWDYTEVYASGTNGFTPDGASYRGVTRGTGFLVPGLIPSTVHYFKIILRDRMGNTSAAINLGSATTPA